MGDFVRDLRYGVRQLLRRPGFSATAIVSLALGIGLNTTLFSVVNGVLLRGGAVARPDELVEIYSGVAKDFPQLTTSYPDYLDLRDGVDSLAGIAASVYVRGILSTGARSALVRPRQGSPAATGLEGGSSDTSNKWPHSRRRRSRKRLSQGGYVLGARVRGSSSASGRTWPVLG